MIKDKKLIETTISSLQYMLDSEDDFIPFDEATNDYMNVFAIDLEDDDILWGDGDSCILKNIVCLLYTSTSPRDGLLSRMPSSA